MARLDWRGQVARAGPGRHAEREFVWKRLGLIFEPDRSLWWMRSHACAPTALHVRDSLYRVYFASRDAKSRSHVGFFEIDLDRPTEVLKVSEKPVLAPGPLGHFDEHGVYAASVLRHEGKIYLYTIGWNRGDPPPMFHASIGLAVSEDGGVTFAKHGPAPIVARSEHDPCSVTGPFVLKEGNRWRMWYVSGYRWKEIGGELQSFYHIKYGVSDDGVNWLREGIVAIDHVDPRERNVARPCVMKDGDIYRAWYSYNWGAGYRIGYAESPDGVRFIRKDNLAGITPSPEGWDSEAMMHPCVVEHDGRWLMFYNGNGFGRDGIGLAVRANRDE